MNSKNYQEPSVFTPQNLLREARRQKNIPQGNVPAVCLLDPDGDIVDYLRRSGQASLCPYWACYHTNLYQFTLDGQRYGIIGSAVGASFAVLLAEQLFVSGCQLLVSITSAGIITPPPQGSAFVLINDTLRDEGTSGHYLPPDQPAQLAPALRVLLAASFQETLLSVELGRSWTTDAPYRETPTAISHAHSQGVTCVEMEASALYAFAEATAQKVVCYAHLTNTMAQTGTDFEKGLENGSVASLALLTHTASVLMGGEPPSKLNKSP